MVKRLLRARDFQGPRDPVRDLAERKDGAIARALAAGLAKFREKVPVDRVAAAIQGWQHHTVAGLLPFDQLTASLEHAFQLIADVHDAAGELGHARAMATRGRRVRKDDESQAMAQVGIGFDRFDPETIADLAQYRADLITGITQQIEQSVNMLLRNGIAQGAGTLELARDIRDSVGLTPQQTMAVANFRRLLENGDSDALDRVLRDARFDSTISSAIESGEAIDDAKIDRMVERYADRYLDYRAETIARTESLRAANDGVRAAYSQIEDRGNTVTRFWAIAPDEKTCEVCRSIPLMNPDGVGLDEQYDSIDGPMDGPQDPHPNCRCTEDFLIESDELLQEAAE